MAIAEFERSIIQERVTAGLRAARAKGTKPGRPETLSQHKPALAELLRQGLGVRAIARQLGLPVASAKKLVRQAREGAGAESEAGVGFSPDNEPTFNLAGTAYCGTAR